MRKTSKPMLTDTILNLIKNVLISTDASITVYLVLIIGSPQEQFLIIGSPQEQFLINGSLQGVFFVIGLPQRMFLGLPSAASYTSCAHCQDCQNTGI